MRFKQQLVILLPLVLSLATYAAVPELTNVSVVGQGKASTVTLNASGSFTHNEYRPADDLLLIDLVGVSAGKFSGRTRTVGAPGVDSYRVVGYSGAGGVQITRVELALKAHPEVHVNFNHEGLIVEVAPSAQAAAAQSASIPAPPAAPNTPAAKTAAPRSTPPASDSSTSQMVEVQNVEVFRGTKGVQVDVSATGPLQPRTMTLKGPDRIVVDLLNATPGGKPRTVNVNANGVVAVRMGRFQEKPPITRVVVDLSGPGEFELVQGVNKLSIKIRLTATAVSSPPVTVPSPPIRVPLPPATFSSPPPTITAPPAADAARQAQVAAPGQLKPAVAQPASEPPLSTVAARIEPTAAAVASPPVTGTELSQKPEPSSVASSSTAATKDSSPRLMAAAAGTAEPPAASPSSSQNAKDLVIVEPNYQVRVSDKHPDQQASQTAPADRASASTPAPTTIPNPVSTQPDKPNTSGQIQPAVNFAAEQRQGSEPAPQASKPQYTGEPISVNLKDVDLKDFFRLIHEISGLNIVLDPTISGSLTLVLDDVPWDQALDIVLKNNGLDRQLDGNVLRIATIQTLRTEAEARRHQVEAQVLAADKVTFTRFLSYAHAKDVLNTVKRLLSPRGDVMVDDRTNGLIISDIPSVIPPIDALLTRLDRKTQQVEIDARVVAATRSFARDIGTQLALGWGNSATAVGGAASGTNTNTVGYYYPPAYATVPGIQGTTTAPTSTTAATIPFFSNLAAAAPTSGLSLINLGHSYRVDAILTAAESRGLLKVLSRPRVITQNNIQAVVKQGQRVPITTYGQLGGPPTATYVEAVLRLTVTPQITAENTVFLSVDIENTTPDYTNQIQGNPVFLTEQTTTQVLVTNGGTVVIGGVLQAQNSLNIQQVPLLGSLPILGNLFKRRNVSTSTQELIFFIMPRIVET
jgi:type IV pilus assembly protein PilQ